MRILALILLTLPFLTSCNISRMAIVDDLFSGRRERREQEREEDLQRQWEEERASADAKTREAADRRQKYVDDHPELDENLARDILYGVVGVGMTREQVRASWGMPDMVNPLGGSSRSVEVWLYGRKQFTFTDGYVTGLYDPDQD